MDAVINLTGARKNLGGRPSYVATEDQRDLVMVLRSNGVDVAVIASILKIAPHTLRKYFRTELRDGFEQIKARIGLALVRSALAGNVAAARYWLITHGGPEWRMPKDAVLANVEDEVVVHFFMPPNHRDEPEPDEPGPAA
jgi:hypothetical protein